MGASRASHTQLSSKARVKRLPARGKGSSSATTPQWGSEIDNDPLASSLRPKLDPNDPHAVHSQQALE